MESGADELRKSELSDSIECLNAAVAVQLPKMLGHTMKIIIDNFNILLRNGHRVPLEHEVLGTRVHAVELSEADKDDSYFVAISLQNTDGEWVLANAMFSKCGAMHAPEDSPASLLLLEHWPQCVFCNKFWRMMKAVADPVSRKQFVKWMMAFLATIEPLAEVNFKNKKFWKLVATVQRAVSGILGMVSPTFGLSSLANVRYVSPLSKEMGKGYFDLADDLPKIGRALISNISKDEVGFWSQARCDFEQYIGPMMMIEEEYSRLAKTMKQVLADVETESGQELRPGFLRDISHGLNDTMILVTQNVSVVRDGAFDEFREVCLKVCQSVFSLAVQHGPNYAAAGEIMKCLKAFLPAIPDATSFQTSVTDCSLEWSGSALSRSFEELRVFCLAVWFATP